MKQYLDILRKILHEGTDADNRTGIPTRFIHGTFLEFPLKAGFPAVTTKKLAIKSCIGEMIGFLRGYDNAAKFRELGSNVWNDNANRNESWLKNPYREGEDSLGRIYGVQARQWRLPHAGGLHIDQLKSVVESLQKKEDNRRLIVSHWNPCELNQMALAPCHILYQFGIEEGRLNLGLWMRSWDWILGGPFNIAGYAWLLSVIAKITDLEPGKLIMFGFNVHVYHNHLEAGQIQLTREPYPLPKLEMNPSIRTLKDLETWVTPEDFHLSNYQHHPAIKVPMAV